MEYGSREPPVVFHLIQPRKSCSLFNQVCWEQTETLRDLWATVICMMHLSVGLPHKPMSLYTRHVQVINWEQEFYTRASFCSLRFSHTSLSLPRIFLLAEGLSCVCCFVSAASSSTHNRINIVLSLTFTSFVLAPEASENDGDTHWGHVHLLLWKNKQKLDALFVNLDIL